MIPELLQHVPQPFNRYIEPFSGSACLFFALCPDNAILSDINADLIHTYSVLRDSPALLHRSVSRMPRTEAFYYELRDRIPASGMSRASRFVYLNRNCFNGVYRTNRQGHFNVPRGKKPGAIPQLGDFLKCAKALTNTKLISGDFVAATRLAKTGDFVYLDPPYAKEGSRRRGEYGISSFDTPDISRLSKCLSTIDKNKATFLLSYADCPEINELKERWFFRTLSVQRHIAGFHRYRKLVGEILVSNRRVD